MSALAKHRLWPKLKKFLKIEIYRRDGGYYRPRFRIEWLRMPLPLRRRALLAKMGCVACGKSINFVRERRKSLRGTPGHLYYAPCCPLLVNIGCSRGAAARDEYTAVGRERRFEK
jgi:hypothetical protein